MQIGGVVGIKFKSKAARDAYLEQLTRPQKRPPSPFEDKKPSEPSESSEQ